MLLSRSSEAKLSFVIFCSLSKTNTHERCLCSSPEFLPVATHSVYKRRGAGEEKSLWWRLLLWGISTSSRSTLACHGGHAHTDTHTHPHLRIMYNCLHAVSHLMRNMVTFRETFESSQSHALITLDIKRQRDCEARRSHSNFNLGIFLPWIMKSKSHVQSF